MNKEKLQKFSEFNPEALADLEIEGIKHEFARDQDAKFHNEVLSMQKIYGLSESAAYQLVILKNKANDKEETANKRRNAMVEYFTVLSKKTGLGFDPYEAAVVQEKLTAAQKEDNTVQIIGNLAKLWGVTYSKPEELFTEAARLRTESVDEVWSNLAAAAFGNIVFLISGLDDDALRTIGREMPYDEMKDRFVKTWEALKVAIRS